MRKEFWVQALKYGIIGVINTLLTAIVIWLMMHPIFQTDKMGFVPAIIITISNITGYIVGLINSFVFNRIWTFKSKNKWKGEFIRFVKAFLICYIPQLILVNLLNTYTNFQVDLKIYIINHADTCQLIGIVFYTSFNFLINKYYTFRQINK